MGYKGELKMKIDKVEDTSHCSGCGGVFSTDELCLNFLSETEDFFCKDCGNWGDK